MSAPYRPTREEAQFIGEVLNIDAGLAKIVRDQLASGLSLTRVRGTLQDAVKIVATVRGGTS